MDITAVYSMLDVGSKIGTITKINMFDETCVYIDGMTSEGKRFKMSLAVEKGDEEDA